VTSEWAVRQTLHGYIRVIRKVSIRFRKQLISCSLGWLGCYGQPPQLRRRVTSTTPPSFGKTSKAKLLGSPHFARFVMEPLPQHSPIVRALRPNPLAFSASVACTLRLFPAAGAALCSSPHLVSEASHLQFTLSVQPTLQHYLVSAAYFAALSCLYSLLYLASAVHQRLLPSVDLGLALPCPCVKSNYSQVR
jgi:hypothetical protein